MILTGTVRGGSRIGGGAAQNNNDVDDVLNIDAKVLELVH